MTNETRYQEMLREAKKLRSAARRAEAKGDYAKASELRGRVEGLNHEMLYLRQHWS
jgi:hypothetical protein